MNVFPFPALRKLVVGTFTTLAIVAGSFSSASAQGGYGSGVGVGFAVNGTCQAGVCPPQATPVNTNMTLPFSFIFGHNNGDQFRFVGNIVAADTNNGFNLPNGLTFMVTYLGNGQNLQNKGPSQASTLSIDAYWADASPAGSFNHTNALGVTFSPQISSASSVSLVGQVNSTQIPAIGPFTPPGTKTGSNQTSVPGNGTTWSSRNIYTMVFGAGSPVGSTIWIDGAAPKTTALTAAILPGARTATRSGPDSADAQGDTYPAVTAFATIINTTTSDAVNCTLWLPKEVPGTMTFQTTNPTTNVPTGTPNTPVTIAAGKSQTFYFAITPTSAFTQAIPILFSCNYLQPALLIPGVNTFLLTSSTTPVADVISIGATPTNDGILALGSTTAIGAFGSAAINIATAGNVTFAVKDAPTGGTSPNLPLTLTLCQTNPSNGQCVNPATPAPSVTINVAQNQTLTFSVFAQAQGTAIPLDPATNRIYLSATQNGVAVGETSVAVRTP